MGRIPVLESLRAGKRTARRLFLLHGLKGVETVLAAAKGIPQETRTRRELEELSGHAVHQGMVLEADPLPVHKADQWIGELGSEKGLLVVLDGVEDPRNFGAIVRSAVACGATAVLFGKDRAAPISPVSVKSAAGAMEYVDLVQATNIVRALEGLQGRGYWVAALDAAGDRDLWDLDLTGPIALVVGGEGKGLRRLVRERCDWVARIPTTGPIKSLNASVSAAIALAECLRQRSL